MGVSVDLTRSIAQKKTIQFKQVLAASVFHYNHTTVASIKRELRSLGVAVREESTESEAKQPNKKTTSKKSDAKSNIDRPSSQSIVPSIDLLGGKVVQLVGGETSAKRIERDDALELATAFSVAGEIAVVDLDAAHGKPSEANEALVRELLRVTPCRVGGGVRR